MLADLDYVIRSVAGTAVAHRQTLFTNYLAVAVRQIFVRRAVVADVYGLGTPALKLVQIISPHIAEVIILITARAHFDVGHIVSYCWWCLLLAWGR